MRIKSAPVLIGIQVILLILSVESQDAITTTSEVPLDETTVPATKHMPYSITGGVRSLPEEFPFMVALGWLKADQKLNFQAGGMLISSKMVLTAAHWLDQFRELPLVFIGGHPVSKFPLYQSNIYSAKNITVFPGYDSNQIYNDIAILELDRAVSFPPICLWTSRNLISDDVIAIGYGQTSVGAPLSKELLKVNLRVYPSEYCEPFFIDKKKFTYGILPTLICAGNIDNGEKDTCKGDSGGPLMVRHNNKLFAVGITSTGIACSGDPPAIYTRISEYIKWINFVLRDRGQCLVNCTT